MLCGAYIRCCVRTFCNFIFQLSPIFFCSSQEGIQQQGPRRDNRQGNKCQFSRRAPPSMATFFERFHLEYLFHSSRFHLQVRGVSISADTCLFVLWWTIVSIDCVWASALGDLFECSLALSVASGSAFCLCRGRRRLRSGPQRRTYVAKIRKTKSLLPGNTKLGVLLT